MKICSKCHQEKSEDNFSKDRRNPDGHYPSCKLCCKQWYESNRKNVLQRQRNHQETLRGRYKTWKASARTRGLEWVITFEDIERMPRVCHYTGVPLNFLIDDPAVISLDRLDSNKGYTKDNVVFCCGFINLMKHTLSKTEFLSACRSIVEHASGNSCL